MGSLRILINSCSGPGGVLVPATQGLDVVLDQAVGWLGSPGEDPDQPAACSWRFGSAEEVFTETANGNTKKQKRKQVNLTTYHCDL